MVTYMTSNVGDIGGHGAEHHLSHPRPWCGAAGAKHNEHEGNSKVYNYGFPEEKEKTPMCRIAELCRHHKIRHEYKLMDESGPAHKKMFTVQLVLSDEEKYEGVGGSIKKAQQNAAMAALKETKREMPPQRGDRNKKKGAPPSPIALLNNTLKQLSMKNPIYTRLESHLHPAGPYNQYNKMRHQNQPMFPQPPRVISAPVPFAPPLPPGHFPKMLPPAPPLLIKKIPEVPMFPLPPRMCVVALTLDSRYPIIYGTAPTFHQAQSHCAVQALLLLGPALTQLEQENKEKNSVGRATTEVEEHCDKENNEDDSESDDTENISNQQKGKSVVSKLHECALQLRMNVEFEIVAEEGPAHDKHYIISCKLAGPTGTCLHADGEGRNKKTAKQAACAALLDKIKDVEKFPLFIAQNLYKTHKKSSQPRDHKRKTIVKDKKMDPEYGHQINPVSRLMQVVQTRGEAEPRFEFISEHGQCRYKEFVVEVTWGGMCCTGTGPNKRLAKRAAAEAMLSHIGFVKPLPPPGKSLLKKKFDPSHMTIGVFDPEEAEASLSERQENHQETEANNTTPKESTTWTELSIDAISRSSDDSDDISPTNSFESSTAVPTEGGSPSPPNGSKRRVTFSNQVCACPPPDDSNYPVPQIAPLKTEMVVVGKLRRKGRDGKRALSAEQKKSIALKAKEFLEAFCPITKAVLVPAKKGDAENDPSVTAMHMESSRTRLDLFAEEFKFSVQYTNFPKSPVPGSEDQYFALVSLGLETPIVCHGSGDSADSAADDAAFNAITSLAQQTE